MKTPASGLLTSIATGILLLAGGSVLAEAGGADSRRPRLDIVDTAIAAGSLDHLVASLRTADLVEILKSPGPFTVFAPSDAAFNRVPRIRRNALMLDRAALIALLSYHVVPGALSAEALAEGGGSSIRTLAGNPLAIDVRDGVRVNGAMVVAADIGASNGAVHVIDEVLVPPNLRVSYSGLGPR